jgi:hypothetical protein
MMRTVKASAVAVLMIAMFAVGSSSATASGPTAVVPYGAEGYLYQQVPTGGGAATFSDVDFDDSGFSAGNAPFGQSVAGYACPLEPATPWSPNTDLLVRRSVSLPAGATDVVIHIAIDNDIQLFWNGSPLGGEYQHEGCAARDSIEVTVPNGLLTAGDNVLAVRAGDRGGETFLDLEVTANLPPDCGSVSIDQTVLWPPNHKFRDVTALGGTDPEGELVALAIASVTQDEPLDDTGDADTAPDADRGGLPANQVSLRAERSGDGDGRVYRVEVVATDPAGASCSTLISIGVPHDQRTSASAVDTTAVVVDSFGLAPLLIVTPADAPNPVHDEHGPPIPDTTPGERPEQTTLSHASGTTDVPVVAIDHPEPPTQPNSSSAPLVPTVSGPSEPPTTPTVPTAPDVTPSTIHGKSQGSGASTRQKPDTSKRGDA